jgi:NADPH-dependent 2,4-dienoyl-CoA reductase/sulfur reductase-like enzyme/rhodanese-related sulfurtransferase
MESEGHKMKLVIVGGVAGGASAAARARRLDEFAHIVLVERGPDVSFANCGMPYYIGNEITDRQKLLVVTPERLRQRYQIDVRTRTEVVGINRQRGCVTLRNVATNAETEESYDRLILATGAAPFRPPMPGLDCPGVMTLRNLEDMDRIRAAVDRGARRAVIVGGGFIGLELVENLVRRQVQCTLLDINPQVLPPFDREMVTPLADTLAEHGVRLVLEASVKEFRRSGDQLQAEFTTGEVQDCDLAIVGVGVRAENQLAVNAGLDVGPRGGIRVNRSMQTSDPLIYAVGDAVETTDFVTGGPTQVPLAGPANRQGRVAADHVFGRTASYRGTQGTAVLGLFNWTAAMTGHSEKVLRRDGRPYRKVYVHPAHHAGYYPGAEPMTLKLLFDPETGRLLGAQGVGGAGVDKRIDVLAMALQAGMTVYDLEEAELCYAPQYGSAKDPINMLGFVASEVLRNEHQQITVEELAATSRRLIDVRMPTEFASGHLPDAVNIPVDELRSRLNELPLDQPLVTYCQVGQRGYLAQRLLKQRGYDVLNLSGGFKTYTLHQLPIVTAVPAEQ